MAGERKTTIFAALTLLTVLSVFVPSFGHCASSDLGQHFATLQDGFRYSLPPQVEKGGLVIAHSTVPIHRKDVRERILKELNYLLQDRRSRVLLWLARADSLRPLMAPILRKYDVPAEFIYLAAIESSYNSRSLSSAGAYGYWQFIKSTALCGPPGCDQYDWRMNITNWKDERADLVHSTHSAARYLAWLNRVKKISRNGGKETEGFNDWLLTAAAYNAGPARVSERLNAYSASSYWDVPLPVETERYVPRWIAVWLISRNRDFYGVRPASHETLTFDSVEKVKLQKDLSFATIAGFIESTPRVIWSLNTQVPPEKAVFPARSGRKLIEHTIHVPKGKGRQLLAQLAAHGYTKK